MAVPVLALIFYLFVGVSSSKQILVTDSNFYSSSANDLVAVVVLYNHGDISPITSFPNDPYYNSSYWPEGYGQLLNKGVLKQYNLGKWLWKRYQNILPEEYSPKDILVYSTDVDRTLMSAEANLAGLYPPIRSHIWEDNFFWEPIPVHLLASDDPILAMNVDCPKYNQLLEELNTTDFGYISQTYSELMDNLTKFTGMEVTSAADARMIFEVLDIYRNHNEFYLPTWIDDINKLDLYYLAKLGYAQETYSMKLKRLKTGPFFDYLISHFSNAINNNADVVKLLILSGHASTISAVMNGMDIFSYIPEFTSTVIWELRRNPENKYFVNTLYKENSADNYIRYGLTNCGFDCAFSNFKTLLKPVTVNSVKWRDECKSGGSIQFVFFWPLIVIVAFLQLLVPA